LLSFNACAQSSGKIRGKVIAPEKNIYTLLLKKTEDSGLIKAEVTDNAGNFLFENIPYRSYFIEVSFLDSILYRSAPFALSSKEATLDDIKIVPHDVAIQEVSIVAQKSIVERKADKIIYNVENTLEPPTIDALAVIQKAPGITLDGDGNISMRGKKGVMVMLNGKLTYISGAQLANLLRTTTASQISRIEVISNPSSKYDAEGNAGIVNIVLKKDQKQGVNGMIVMSYGMGKYHKAVEGVNINWKRKRTNVFASYNYFNDKGFNNLMLRRQFYTNGVYEGAYRQHNYLVFPNQGNLGKLGIDHNLSSKTVIGIAGNVTANDFNPDGNNRSQVENTAGSDVSYYTSQNNSREKWYNFGINGNIKHTFDSGGAELSADVDYAQYGSHGIQQFVTKYYDLNDVENKSRYLLTGDVKSLLTINAAKADLTLPLSNGRKMEMGAKSSLVHADNDLAYSNSSSGTAVFDPTQSNHFIYSENINALYTTYSAEKEKWSVQAGLRTEQTVAAGHQLINDQRFYRNYWQLFPTLFLTHKANEHNDFGLSLSRRIQRPSYDQMNPIRLFIDATTFKEGNPFLVPQNSYQAELSHTYRQKYLTTFSASYVNKSITEVLIPDEHHSNITIQTNKNINEQLLYSLNVSVPVQIAKWWSTRSEATLYYSHYTGQLANFNINSGTTSFNAKTIQTFTLPRQLSLQADAFIQGREQYSFSSSGAYGAVNLSMQKTLKNKRSTLKLSATDVFFTAQFSGSSTFTNYYEHYHVNRNSRVVSLSFTHRYGKTGLPRIRQRGTGSDDERQRAGKSS